jgi:K+ potassium transporter
VRHKLILGGTFVLYMTLSRHLHLDTYTPHLSVEESNLTLSLAEAEEPTAEIKREGLIQRSWIVRLALLGWSLYGASAVVADGLLTPSVSVINAVSGSSP